MPIEITNTRRIEAACEQVFHAFANPTQLAQWWGPAGFTNTVPEFDFRPGGLWRIVMRAPDGNTYDNRARFLEIVRPERIVYEHLQPMHTFTMTMHHRALSPHATELSWHMCLERNEQHERLQEFLHQANEQNFDRLGVFLAANPPPPGSP